MTTYAYARVSTKEQTTARQLTNIDDHVIVYEDKLSGKNTDRPQLQAMLNALQSGDIVLVYSIDRLARDTLDLLTLTRDILAKNCTLKFITEGLSFYDGLNNPMNELTLTIMAAIAKFERTLINKRCEEGRRIALANGVKFGVKSKLSDDDKQFIIDNKGLITQSELAAKFNMSVKQIGRIQNGTK